VGKYGSAGWATDANVEHAHCMLVIKATNTHSENVTLIAFQRQHWLREGLSVLRNKYIAFLADLASCFVTFRLALFIIICQVTESLQCSLCNE
jgi:hypothetical protein